MKSVVVTFGKGDPKKGSVRVKPLSVELVGCDRDDEVSTEDLGDIYVGRDIMKVLGLSDSDKVKITFEAVNG